MKAKIRKGDKVAVISGKLEDKNVQGEVIKVDPDENRVVVQGVNMRTKHQRQVQSKGRTLAPGLVKFEGPISLANVMLVCPKCGKKTRVEIQREEDKAVRVCKRCKALIDD
jgi:large subunit ribosomal protein L24